MFRKSIRKSVMKVINKRIEEAQKAHDAEVDELNKNLELDIVKLRDRCNIAKSEVEDRHVNSIIGKLI